MLSSMSALSGTLSAPVTQRLFSSARFGVPRTLCGPAGSSGVSPPLVNEPTSASSPSKASPNIRKFFLPFLASRCRTFWVK